MRSLFVTYFPSSLFSLKSFQQMNIQNTQGLEQLTGSGGPFDLITGNKSHEVVLKQVLCVMTSEKEMAFSAFLSLIFVLLA